MCVRAHMRTALPAKDFILVLELCNLIQQTTTKLLLKEQLYTTIFNHAFPCFFSYHTWCRLHHHLYQAIDFEDIKCNVIRIY